MTNKFDIAVVGATGVVGEAMLGILAERKFPVGNVYALASERSIGKTVEFGNRELDVDNLAEFDFSQVSIGLFSAGAAVSAEYAPKAAAAGCVIVDFPDPGLYAGVAGLSGDFDFLVQTQLLAPDSARVETVTERYFSFRLCGR